MRNKNVLLTIIIDETNYINENENNSHYILNSQFKNQKPLSNIDINFNDTIDENNDALNDFTLLNETRRFEDLMLI